MTPTGELHSWARHLADDVDPVMVERLIDGMRPAGYTAWERREAVRRMQVNGMCQREIAERIGVAERQVHRDLERASLCRSGWQQIHRTAAARRRVIVERLYAAGVRPIEVATLLRVSPSIASQDRVRLGIPPARRTPSPGRSRDELLATYGHLLHDEEAVA